MQLPQIRRPGPPIAQNFIALSLLALLAACGGGGGSENPAPKHDAVRINSAGRLSLAASDSKQLHVLNLDAINQEAQTFNLDFAPSALYASPNLRYVLIPQRMNDQVQFLDAGLWQEDHGDHLHDYQQAPQLLNWRLSGVRPTHYDVQAGKQAAFFMDGDSSTTPAKFAAVKLLSDASIAKASTLAELSLNYAIHGLAEPVDDKLLVAQRASDAGDSLPTHLQLYLRQGNQYQAKSLLSTRCDGMHGSYSVTTYTVTGCKDGVMLVKHLDASNVSSSFLSAPLRIGSFAGHPKLSDQVIGLATEGASGTQQTTRFYQVLTASGSLNEVKIPGWDNGRLRRAHAFDRTANRLFLLDDTGNLTVLQRAGNRWDVLQKFASLIKAMPTSAPHPAMVANEARDEIYLSDPVAKQILVLDSKTGNVLNRRQLSFSPSALSWNGIKS